MGSKMDEKEKMFTKPGRKMCPDHDEEDLRFFCLSCEVPICRDCKVVAHDGHKADLVTNVAKEMREKLVQILEKTEVEISKLKEEMEGTSEKADTKGEKVPSDQDTMDEIRNIANETKADIDKLVTDIESEIQLHDEEPNAERLRPKMAKLAAFKESVNEALESDYATVKAFKVLVEEDAKYSEETPEDVAFTRTIVKLNLLADFKVFFGQIIEDVRNFDVKRVATDQLITEKRDGSENVAYGGVRVGDWFRSTSGMRFQSLRNLATRLSMGTCFWILRTIFCFLPIVQSVPIFMLLFNAYPDVHPVASMIVSVICVASGFLMLSGNSRLQYGAMLYTGILAYLAIYSYISPPVVGQSLIWSRHQGCMGLYLLFAGKRSHNKAVGTVGDLFTTTHFIYSAMILWDGRVHILFPGGKLGFIAFVLLLMLLSMFLKENSQTVKMALCCSIVLASSLIVINNADLLNSEWHKTLKDKLVSLENRAANSRYNYISKSEWDEYHNGKTILAQYEKRLYWTVVRLIVCNANMVIGILIDMEEEVTTFCQRLFQFVKVRMAQMDHHRN